MESMILVLTSRECADLLNGDLSVLVRKKFPKDYVGWVYIYCTKEQGLARLYNGRWNDTFVCEKDITDNEFKRMYSGYDGKGKVVGRFWCDKVEEIPVWKTYLYANKKTCLSKEEIKKYLNVSAIDFELDENYIVGKAIHITKVKPFDKPKEIGEFKRDSGRIGLHATPHGNTLFHIFEPLTHAPTTYCYIEVDA